MVHSVGVSARNSGFPLPAFAGTCFAGTGFAAMTSFPRKRESIGSGSQA